MPRPVHHPRHAPPWEDGPDQLQRCRYDQQPCQAANGVDWPDWEDKQLVLSITEPIYPEYKRKILNETRKLVSIIKQ